MNCWRTALWLSLLGAAMLALAGCSARSGAGETATAAGAAPLVADLPALVIDYDRAGQPTVGGVPLETFDTVLPAPLIAQLQFPTSTLTLLRDANIQHIQASNTPHGLRLLVNGQPLPTLAWDEASLSNASSLLAASGLSNNDDVQAFLPLLTGLGAGLVLRFAPEEGAAPIPLEVTGAAANANTYAAARTAFLDGAGSTPTVRIPVHYAADGTWEVHGLSDSEWQALTGFPFGALRLNPDLLQNAVAAGIGGATLRLDAKGIQLTIGDAPLPYLSWEDGGLQTALDLARALGLLDDLPLDRTTLDQLLTTWLPALQASEVVVEVRFLAQ